VYWINSGIVMYCVFIVVCVWGW